MGIIWMEKMSGIIEATNVQAGNIKSITGNAAITVANDGGITLASPLPISQGGTGSSSFTASTMTLETTTATTSGTAVDYGSIPSGTKRISIMFNAVTGANASVLIRLGTSSGLTTSGYVTNSSWGADQVQDTSGFIVYGSGGGNTISGILTICHMGSNLFVGSHAVRYNSSNGVFGGGHVQLGGTLDRLRVQMVSGGAFSGGSVNIMYES